MSERDSDVEAGGAKAAAKKVINTFKKSDAEEVAEQAQGFMDGLMDTVNGTLGDDIANLYTNVGGDEGPSVDVLMLLATLALSKLGLVLNVNLDWSAFDDAFGWTAQLSVLNTITVPSVPQNVIVAVIGVALLLVQPVCVLRMNYLALEHQRALPQFPSQFKHTWLTRNTVMRLFPLDLKPRLGECCCSFLSPLTIVLWAFFWLAFIVTSTTGDDTGAGLSFFLLACPALYFSAVNYFRSCAWQYVNLRMAPAVKTRQYENLCMREGSFVLFLFVASYAFVTNFFIQLLATWDQQTGGQNTALVIGFIVYFTVPLWYVHRIITDETADRTFRLFRSQLVDAFTDAQMYTKVALLVENVLFAMTVLVFSASDAGQLTGGLIVGAVFLLYYLRTQPYEDDMENYSDLIARVCQVATVIVGLVLATSDSANPTAISAVLIIISSIGTLWFLYTLDLKAMFMGQFFLLLQLHAQRKAATYTEARIKSLPARRVRKIVASPIEIFVLSAVQKIHFAVHQREAFFSGELIKQLSDLDVTWLDLQQCGYTVTKLKAVGFTTEELMAVESELDDMGDRSDIRALYEGAYNDAIALKEGKEDGETLALLHTLGCFYRDMGEHVRAMETLQKCLKARREVLGEAHVDTGRSMAYIGAYYTFLGASSEGTQLLRDALTLFKEDAEVGPEHEFTLDAMAGLGANLKAVGFSKEATQVLNDRLTLALKVAAGEKRRPDHPCTLSARLDYATVLLAAGNLLGVAKLDLRRVLNRQKTIYGSESRDTLKLMDSYVLVLEKLGKHKECMAQNAEVVGEKAATLGDEHSGTLASKFALARSLIELSRTREAEALRLERSLKLQEERLGATHPTVILCKIRMGGIYNERGRFEEALAMFTEAYNVRKESLGADHELTLGMSNNIANMLTELGRMTEAISVFNETLNKMLAKYGEEHQNTIGIMINYGSALQNSSQFDTAEAMYKRALGLAKKLLGDDHPLTVTAFDAFGALNIVKGNFAAAAQLFEQSLRIKANMFEPYHNQVVISMESLASCYNRLQRAQESIALYRQVVTLREEHMGRYHSMSIKARAGLAIALCDVGQAQESFTLINQCIADGGKALGSDHPMVTEYIGVLGHVCLYLTRNDLALQYTDQALQRTIKESGATHFKAVNLQKKKDWIINHMSGNSAANNASQQAAQAAQAAQQEAAQKAQAAISSMNPIALQMFKDAQTKSNEAQGYAACNEFLKAIPIYESVFADTALLAYVGTPEGDAVQLGSMLLNMKVNFGICLFKSGQAEPTIKLLEEILPELEAMDPAPPIEGITMVRNMLQQVYTGTQRHKEAMASITADWKYQSKRFGEASEQAITLINNRANYHFALKDYPKAMADHQEVLRLLILLQGEDHADTVGSIKATTEMFAKVGVKFIPFPNRK